MAGPPSAGIIQISVTASEAAGTGGVASIRAAAAACRERGSICRPAKTAARAIRLAFFQGPCACRDCRPPARANDARGVSPDRSTGGCRRPVYHRRRGPATAAPPGGRGLRSSAASSAFPDRRAPSGYGREAAIQLRQSTPIHRTCCMRLLESHHEEAVRKGVRPLSQQCILPRLSEKQGVLPLSGQPLPR